MEKKFYCKICNSEFSKKKNAKNCKKTHLKVNVKVDTKTVMKIFDEYFNSGNFREPYSEERLFRTTQKVSFEEFFIEKVSEAYRNNCSCL